MKILTALVARPQFIKVQLYRERLKMIKEKEFW